MTVRMNVPCDRTSRRRFLRLTGTAMVLIPLVNLSGCAEEAPEPPPEPESGGADGQPMGSGAAGETTQSQPAQSQPAQGQTSGASSQPAGGAGELVKLEESNPQAQGLGYKHDASEVDTSAYPRYEEGQLCSNCSLYVADQGDEEGWGGCQIFPGKLVNADGWCSAYVAAS